MKYLLVLSVFMFGCASQPLCPVATSLSKLVSQQIASSLSCKNEAAVEASVVAQLAKANICLPAGTSVIGDVICGPLINGLMSSVLTQQLPAAWQCSGGSLGDALKAKLLATCQNSL